MLFDVEADSLLDVINLMLDEAELKKLTTPVQRDAIIRVFSKEEAADARPPNSTKESCRVYCATLSFLKAPLLAMVRLKNPIVVESTRQEIRYYLFALGNDATPRDEWPPIFELTYRLHEIGRSFSLMMSQNWFSNAARKINGAQLFFKLMDHFMARCMMLPPPDPLSQAPFTLRREDRQVTPGCWKKRDSEKVVMMIPSNTYQRATHQLRHRQRVIQDRDVELARDALTKEPTVEDLEAKPTPFLSHLTPRDIIVGIVTAIACLAVMLLLNLHDFEPPVRLPHVSHA